jgi:hypothetical protein
LASKYCAQGCWQTFNSQNPSIEEGIAKALDNIDTQRKLYVVEKSTQPLNEKHKEHRHHEEHKPN